MVNVLPEEVWPYANTVPFVNQKSFRHTTVAVGGGLDNVGDTGSIELAIVAATINVVCTRHQPSPGMKKITVKVLSRSLAEPFTPHGQHADFAQWAGNGVPDMLMRRFRLRIRDGPQPHGDANVFRPHPSFLEMACGCGTGTGAWRVHLAGASNQPR